MEEEAPKNKTTGWLLVIFVVAGVLLLGVSAFFIFQSVGGGNSLNKGTAPNNTPEKVTDPENQKLVAEIKRATNPSLTIAEKKDSLVKIKSFIATNITALQANTSLNADIKQQRLNLYNRISSEIDTFSTNADKATTSSVSSGNNSVDLTKLSIQINQDLLELQKTLATTNAGVTGLIKLADDIITRNNGGALTSNGHSLIRYKFGGFSLSAAGIDCSGFLSYLLGQIHVMPIGTRTTSYGFGNLPGFATDTASTMSNFLSVYGKANIVQAAKDGKLKPGDIIFTGDSIANCRKGHDGTCHVVMYIGPTPDDPHSVIESTTTKRKSGTKEGPQYSSLVERSNHYETLAIYHPPYEKVN